MAGSLVLASASPFRRMLLENAGIRFQAKAAEIDERAIENQVEQQHSSPEEVALILAEAKARHVGGVFPEDIIIGSDQTMSRLSQAAGYQGSEGASAVALRTDPPAKQRDRLDAGGRHPLETSVCRPDDRSHVKCRLHRAAPRTRRRKGPVERWRLSAGG